MERYLIYSAVFCFLFFIISGCTDGELPAEKYFEKGVVYLMRDNDEDLAIKYFNKAIEKNPNYAVAYTSRGVAYTIKGEYDKAIEDHSRAIAIDKNYVQAYVSRGFAYLKKGDYNRAIEDYNKVIAIDPGTATAYINRGVVYAKKGEYDRAVADCNKSIDLNPDSASYYKCALIYSLKGDVAVACDWLNKAIEAGFKDWDFIKQDPDLNKSRNSGCYKQIMKGH